jgi:hypothetical protein
MPLVDPANPTNDSWRQQGDTEYGASIVLSAGLHDIEMHMYERGGGATAQLRWSAIPTNPADPAIPKQIIPSIWLWPPLYAAGPNPPHLSTVDNRKPALEWISGLYAETHDLYFSANYDDVNDRNPLVRQTLTDPCYPYPAAASPLELGRTYYWCVDEVKTVTERWDARSVWEFTINECISIDNFEDYNDRGELRLVWTDGYASVIWGGTYPYHTVVQGGSSGSNLNLSSAVGTPTGGTGPVRPTPLNFDAMVLRYDNDGLTYTGLPGAEKWIYPAPYFSEIEKDTVSADWSGEGVKSLSLWFQGHPLSAGSYDATGGTPETTWPKYTVSGRGRGTAGGVGDGATIEGRHDEFYFLANYPLTGAGTVQVKVISMDNTDPWARAGLMIREKWTPYSKYAAVYVTPGNGVTFQWRENEDGPVQGITKPGIEAPEHLKLERTFSGNFIAKHSETGSAWLDVNSTTAPQQPLILMGSTEDPNLYIGTAVTSHDALETCTAGFDKVQVFATPAPTNWVFGNIGTNSAGSDANQLYVALSDSTNTVVVNHPDPYAVTLTDWQEWNIELTEFAGLNLSDVRKVRLGVGDRVSHPEPGGSGTLYIDDFRACPPRCVASIVKPLYDIAQPYDCIVDEKDLSVLAGDWLMRDRVITTAAPPTGPTELLAHYQFEGNYLDSTINAKHLTDPCGTAPGFDTGVVGSFALSLDGVEDHLAVEGVGIDGNVPRSIACWAKSDSMTITDWTLIFGFSGMADATGGNGSHFNIGYSGSGIVPLEPSFIAHVWGWEEQILPLDVDVWHHFAMTYDGTTIRYYGDGVELDTDPDKSNDRNLVHADRVHVGKRATSDLCFPGDVDDARIYNVVLSEAEVAYLATQGALTLHIPIPSDADLYQGEPQGSQWINLKDYSVMTGSWLEQILWP